MYSMARGGDVKAIIAAMGVAGCFVMPAWAGSELESSGEKLPSPAARDTTLALTPVYYHWRLPSESALFGSVVTFGKPVFGSLSASVYGIDSSALTRASYWLGDGGYRAPVLTLGYAWRNLVLESFAFSLREQDNPPAQQKNVLELDSGSTRFSYRPSPGWSFQLTRGNLSGLDQLNPGRNVRRTCVSTTYRFDFRGGDWQTTLAWGRNTHTSQESSMGYLLESAMRLGGVHALFGRLEQVRSDELARQNEMLQRELFKLRKLTVGYYRAVNPGGTVEFDIGAFVSRYFVPSFAVSSYGSEPTAYMLFVRARFR